MTSFDDPTILMALDEYYDQCVLPKPRIPKRYGHSVNKTERQAARLQSYKDGTGDDEEEEEEDEEETEGPLKVDDDEFEIPVKDTNLTQINFETDDFNQLYEEPGNAVLQNKSVKPAKAVNMSVSSAQWRIKPNNVNRPAGAPPLVPNDAQRDPPRQTNKRWGCGRRRFNHNNNQYTNYKNNNHNRHNNRNWGQNRLGYNSQRGQMPMDQRMRNTYNAFNDAPNVNNNHIQQPQQQCQQQQQVLMNIKNHFQSNRSQLNVSAQLNPSNIPNSNLNGLNINQVKWHQNQGSKSSSNFQLGSNSLTSLINSANQIPDKISSHNNVVNRLGPITVANSNGLVFENSYGIVGSEQPNLGNRNNQLQRVPSGTHGSVAGSESLRLADLMNMDKGCKNFNVAEVAKNAMLMLSTVFHKPILDDNVQQELSQLQHKSGVYEEPHGLEMNIIPQATGLRMYHRFK